MEWVTVVGSSPEPRKASESDRVTAQKLWQALAATIGLSLTTSTYKLIAQSSTECHPVALSTLLKVMTFGLTRLLLMW